MYQKLGLFAPILSLVVPTSGSGPILYRKIRLRSLQGSSLSNVCFLLVVGSQKRRSKNAMFERTVHDPCFCILSFTCRHLRDEAASGKVSKKRSLLQSVVLVSLSLCNGLSFFTSRLRVLAECLFLRVLCPVYHVGTSVDCETKICFITGTTRPFL